MEELLAVTDAAVKALDKSTISQSSSGSHSSRHSTSHSRPQEQSHSRDSGICKTYTTTENRHSELIPEHLIPVHDSDDSTTASDVLIRSTIAYPEDRSFSAEQNAYDTSKCSKTSIGSENFNTSGPQKVKISTKRLREIKSPFDTEISPRVEDNDRVPKALLGKENTNTHAASYDKPIKEQKQVFVLRGSDSNNKNVGLNDVKPIHDKKLIQPSSPAGSQKSVESGRSQNSAHSGRSSDHERSQMSIHSGKSQISVNSVRSQNSFHSERSQNSVHSGRSQNSVHSGRSQHSVHSELEKSQNSVHSGRSHNSVHSGRSQKSVHSEYSRTSNHSGISQRSNQRKPSHTSTHSEQFAEHDQLHSSHVSEGSQKSNPSMKSDRSLKSEHSVNSYASNKSEKLPASDVRGKNKEKSSYPRGIEDRTHDSGDAKVSRGFTGENGVEYSPSDKGEPPDVLIERHTPKKLYPAERKKLFADATEEDDIDKQVAAELNGSLDFVPQRENENSNAFENSIGSQRSSQPEIITVPERIVTVTARTSLSSADVTASEADSVEMVSEEKVPPKLPARSQLLSKMQNYQGPSLRQGAPVEGAKDLDKHRQSPDVRISNYQLSEKQRQVKQMFTKRFEQMGPKRRVVQPHFVQQRSSDESDSGGTQKLSAKSSEAITAAVAASAAVAATQPFLKAQQDLESKMAQILEKMADLQGVKSGKQVAEPNERVMELERQVSHLTEQRIEHLEKLQETHMHMQAKLLSLTRTNEKPRSQSSSPARSPPIARRSDNVPKKAFSKTTLHRSSSPPRDRKSPKSHQYAASPLDTPNPRSRAPKPAAYDQQSRGILEEILASAGSPLGQKRGITVQQPIYTREKEQPSIQARSPNVKKAEKLVEELSTLKDQMQELVTDVQHPSVRGRDKEQAGPGLYREITAEELLGPSPLDPYLMQSEAEPLSPYKHVPHLSPNRFNAPVRSLPEYIEAKQVLQQVGRNKAYLEANLESVMRGRQEAEVFTMLENVYQDSCDRDKVYLQHKVNEWVADLRKQVEREVTDDVIIAELQKKNKPVLKVPPPSHSAGQFLKPNAKVPTKGFVGAKIDTGLKRDRKPLGSALTAVVDRLAGTSKENKPTAPKRPMIKRAGGPLHPDDETYMTRVYGKAAYQNKRSTLKGDPYLHYQNTPQQKAPRTPLRQEVQGTEVKSAKTQTGGGVKQFYFSPASGTYIPVANVNIAPIPGQLIPMAVPLGGPRMDGGLKEAVTVTSGPVTSTPVTQPRVTAKNNVTLVSVPVDDGEGDRKISPELEKQVLPSVDIDSDISEVSEPVRSNRGIVQMKSPQKSPTRSPQRSPPRSPVRGHREVTYHKEEESDEELSDDDMSPENAPGLALPGYCPPSPVEIKETPVFTSQITGAEKFTQASDLIAEDIRRRDVLESNATQWIEQELMARMISELYPLKPDEPKEMPHVDYEESIDSTAEDPNESMFLMDAIGRDGLQLFVDAGQPVNSNLVNALIKEVLTEKVTSMLGQKPDDERQTDEADVRAEAKLGASGMHFMETGMSPEDDYDGMIPTPEPTPKGSPITSPTRVLSPPYTPPESPKMERIQPEMVHPPVHAELYVPESEPESESVDISEEIRKLKDKLVVRDPEEPVETAFDIMTPVATPVPELSEEDEPTPISPPKPSPRQPVKEVTLQISAPVAPSAAAAPPPQPPPQPEPPLVEEVILSEETDEPQPWGDSPVPEENPNYSDNELDRYQDPYALTVAPTEEQLGFIPPTEIYRPTPPPLERKRSVSPSPSETETTSIISSVTDTSNMEVSEGQWLLCKSDGEVADFNIDQGAMQRMASQFKHKSDVSMASTLHSTDDIQDETADMPISEGEFQYKPDISPEQDPLLMLLSKFQSQKRHQEDTPQPGVYGIPGMSQYDPYGQFDMTSNQVQDLLNYTGRSTGEISLGGAGGVSVKKSYGEVIRVGEPRRSAEDLTQQDIPTRDHEPHSNRSENSYVNRSGSPLRMMDLKRESIQEETEQELQEAKSQSLSEKSSERDVYKSPMRDGRPQSSRGRPTPPRGGQRMSPGGVSIGAGGRTSPVKSSLKKPPQAGRSQGVPERSVTLKSRGMTGNSEDSLEFLQSTMSDGQGTRTFTPDQMNMESLIQSGYLNQNFSQSGEFGQSAGMSQSLDMQDSQDSLRQRNKGKSLGLTYSFGDSLGGATDSLDESELRQLATTGTLKMSVTIPGAEDDSESI